MTKTQNIEKSENDLRETIELANKIVSFYEEILSANADQIERLELENKELSKLLSEAKSLLRDSLQTPKRSLIN